MRDINRIEPFMAELGELWKKSAPDMRFGQFIMNVFGEITPLHGDPFFWEEDAFMKYVKEIDWIKGE